MIGSHQPSDVVPAALAEVRGVARAIERDAQEHKEDAGGTLDAVFLCFGGGLTVARNGRVPFSGRTLATVRGGDNTGHARLAALLEKPE
jgi:hypothetical protein